MRGVYIRLSVVCISADAGTALIVRVYTEPPLAQGVGGTI